MAKEIILSQFQSEIFNAAEQLLKTQGYLGESLFEDSYVLNKKLAQYIVMSVPQNGQVAADWALKSYNAVLGIRARGGLEPGAIDKFEGLGGVKIDQSLLQQDAVFNPNSKEAGKYSKYPTSPGPTNTPGPSK